MGQLKIYASLSEQKTTFFPMHLVGAILTFGVGAIYILVQTLLSHYMQPHIHSKTTFVVRLTILVWTLGSIISSILKFPLSVLKHIWKKNLSITWKKKYDTNFSLDDRNSCGLNEISVTWFSRNPLRFQNKSLLCCFSLKLILSQLILGTEKSSFYCLS